MKKSETTAQSLWQQLKELVMLKLDYAKLTLAERLTMLLTMLALGLITILLGAIVVFFLSVALAEWIAQTLGMAWSCLIVAGVYVLLIAVVYAARKTLIVNPLARVISKMIV